MFSGEYDHQIDEKGRMMMPAKFREQLGEEFVITRGFDHCLWVYPLNEWAKIESEFEKMPPNKDSRRLQRLFFASAEHISSDKSGRIVLPAKLREAAGLKKEIVTVGVLRKLEIWDKELWEENAEFDDMEDLAENLAEFDIHI